MTTIKFNVNAGRYANEKGQFIKESFVTEKLQAFRQQSATYVKGLLVDFHNSTTKDHDQLLENIANKVKDTTIVNYIVGRGGIKQVTADNIKDLQSRLDTQLNTSFNENGQSFGLQEVISALENGEISPQMGNYRIERYVQAARTAYFAGVADRDESPYMQRTLHGDDHCPECIQYESAGVVSKGELPLPGEDCSCRSNCNCTVEYLSNVQFQKWQKTQLSNVTDSLKLL